MTKLDGCCQIMKVQCMVLKCQVGLDYIIDDCKVYFLEIPANFKYHFRCKIICMCPQLILTRVRGQGQMKTAANAMLSFTSRAA